MRGLKITIFGITVSLYVRIVNVIKKNNKNVRIDGERYYT